MLGGCPDDFMGLEAIFGKMLREACHGTCQRRNEWRVFADKRGDRRNLQILVEAVVVARPAFGNSLLRIEQPAEIGQQPGAEFPDLGLGQVPGA